MITKNKTGFTMIEVALAVVIFAIGVAAIHMLLNSQMVKVDKDYLEALNIASYILEEQRGKVFGQITSTEEYDDKIYNKFPNKPEYIEFKPRFIYKIEVNMLNSKSFNCDAYTLDDLTGTFDKKGNYVALPLTGDKVPLCKIVYLEVKWLPQRFRKDMYNFKKYVGNMKMQTLIVNRNVRFDIKVGK